MKIRSRSDLEFMERIQREVTSLAFDDSYYEFKLSAAWNRAAETPAYRSLCEFSPGAFRDLPVTTKSQLKAAPLEFVRVPVASALKYYQTTGTTGRPTPTPRTANDMIANTVSVAEAWRPLLAGQDHRALILLPSDVVPVADLIVGVCEFLGVPHAKAYPFTTGISDWDRIIELCEVLRPTVLFIAPGVLLQFSQTLMRRELLSQLRSSVRMLMLLGEVSTVELRGMVARWWDASVLDASYGSTESGTLAACCAHDRLHLLPGANYFEVQTSEGMYTAVPGRGGSLIATPLNNDARPLLRLEMGDEVTLAGDCPCGSAVPTVTIRGRQSDATAIKGVRVMTRDVEGVVYGSAEVMGYLIETDDCGSWARLLLERIPGADRADEAATAELVQLRTHQAVGLRWDEIQFVNRLGITTKSGGSQKSWKRSNFRVVATAEAS